jgi:hypothetical protein
MEQAIKGQIGHPAACMMENKLSLRAGEILANYGAGKPSAIAILKSIEVYGGCVKRKTI